MKELKWMWVMGLWMACAAPEAPLSVSAEMDTAELPESTETDGEVNQADAEGFPEQDVEPEIAGADASDDTVTDTFKPGPSPDTDVLLPREDSLDGEEESDVELKCCWQTRSMDSWQIFVGES